MTAHTLVITDDSIRLEHICHGCKEGEYEERYGLDSFLLWPAGSYPIEWSGDFYGDEWDERLGLVYPALPEVSDDDATPASAGVLRGDVVQRRPA